MLAPARLRFLLLVLPLLAAGCLQLETCVRLNEDGSANVTERLRFSRQLLDLAGDKKDELLKLLTKDAALERMKQMGKGIALVKHDLHDAEGGGRESLAEYKIDDFNEFRYISPWPSFTDYGQNNVIACSLEPKYTCGSSGGQAWAGLIMVHFNLTKHPRGADDGKKPTDPPEKGPSPAEQQLYRELGPIFRDTLKDFLVRFTFDSYCPVVQASVGVRNRGAAPTAVDLINFSGQNLDNWGASFLSNEEVMLELVRGNLAGPNIATHVRDYERNLTVPVFLPLRSGNWWGGQNVCIRPSRALFDRYFKGKMLDYRPWTKDPPVPAEFDKIGWKDTRGKSVEKPDTAGKP